MNREVRMRRTHFESVLVVAALFVVLLPAHSQSSPITFERTYGGPGDDLGSCAQQTTDGGYIVTGGYDILSDSGSGYLVKTDAYGDTVWTRKLGGAWVQQTTDSGFIVLGGVDTGIWLVKTDADGDTLWTRIYAGNNAASMVEQTADGGFVMAGTASYSSPSGGDVYVVKTDAGGDTLWTRTYGGPRDDEGLSIRQTSDHGYIIDASTTSFGSGNQQIWLIKTDSMGDTLWTRTFGGDSWSYSGWAQQTTDVGYFVAGWTWSYSPSPQTYLIKTDAAGDTLWTRRIGGSGWFEGMSGQQVKDGGYIVVGGYEDTTGGIDVLLVRTDANGDTLWTRTIGGSSFDLGCSVQQTADGGYVICGETYSFGAGAADFYLIKTDENGNLAVAEPKSSPSRKSVLSLTSEPNPFRSATVLHLPTGQLDLLSTHLRIYDAQGRLVRTLAVGQARETMWNGRNDAGQLLPSGTYMVRCDAGGERATTRLVLQR
jgi:hypothetical protein